jgi:hypothetical protein
MRPRTAPSIRARRAALGVLPASLLGGLVVALTVLAMSTTVLRWSVGFLFVGLAGLIPWGQRLSANR